MRKIFTFLSVVFIAIAVYIAYGTFQSAQQFERDSIQRANQANALSQQIADAQALQQETSSEEYAKLETMFNAGNAVAQAQTQALQDQTDTVSSELQTSMQTYIVAGDKIYEFLVYMVSDRWCIYMVICTNVYILGFKSKSDLDFK